MENQALTNIDSATVAAEIIRRFDPEAFSESACRRALLPIFRPVLICPGCKVQFSETFQQKILDGRTVTCSCGRKSSPRSGTKIENIKASFRQVLMVVAMRRWSVSFQEIANHTKLSDDTVRRLCNRLGVA